MSVASLATAVESRDPETGLAAVAALRRLVEELETLHVENARRNGWSWQAIADVLGVTRQTVHKKHHVRRGLRRGH
jgi:IS30 family transposase